MSSSERFIPRHGGYKNLLTYRLTELIFDITVRFCRKFVPVRDRTHDQMVQSGRSGYQNIGEGSVDSGVSKKSEIKLTGISVGCQEELAKDYRKYLEHHGLAEWREDHSALQSLKDRRVEAVDDFRRWVKDVWEESDRTLPTDEIVANGALSLLNLSIYLTKRQLESLEKAFLREGGITERMYRLRRQTRDKKG